MFLQQSDNDLLIGLSFVTDFLQFVPGGWCYLDCGYHKSYIASMYYISLSVARVIPTNLGWALPLITKAMRNRYTA
jgi:hypothetical protein